MSRSNPSDHLKNPSTRWFEWNGENGVVRYYDKDAKKNIDVPLPFTFMLLDQLSSVRGWHEASKSGIYSNEVKDTRQETMLVRCKVGTLAEGVYRDIKDRVNTIGGSFNANCYLAFKNGGSDLSIGCLRFKGSALGAWMDFCKANRSALYTDAIRIVSYTEGKKGRITFRVPVFAVASVAEDTNERARELDAELQDYLETYLARRTNERAQPPADDTDDSSDSDDSGTQSGYGENYDPSAPITDDDIPF